jgi:hypothetical protein
MVRRMSDPQPETPPLSGSLFEQTERRTDSIYSRFQAPRDSRAMAQMFNDSDLPLALQFSAVFAAFASFGFPLQLSAFRSLIPHSAWKEHFRFRYTGLRTGPPLTFCGPHEWDYQLRIGPQSGYGLHVIHIVTNSDFERDAETFAPPLDSSVVRFTLCHPFLQPELHDPTGIYLFASA